MSLIPKSLQLQDTSANNPNIFSINASTGGNALIDSLTLPLRIGGTAPSVSVVANTGNLALNANLGNVIIANNGGNIITFPKTNATANGQYLAVNTDGTSSFQSLPSLAQNPLTANLDANGYSILNLSSIDISNNGAHMDVSIDASSNASFANALTYNFDNLVEAPSLRIPNGTNKMDLFVDASGNAQFTNATLYNFNSDIYAPNFISTTYNLEALGAQVANLQSIINNLVPQLN